MLVRQALIIELIDLGFGEFLVKHADGNISVKACLNGKDRFFGR